MSNGMTFNSVASSTLHITRCVPLIPLLPERSSVTTEITGRDGILDFENDSYKSRIIPVDILMDTAASESELKSWLADVAVWLSGTGYLIFDDDTTKQWYGKVYRDVDQTRIPKTAQFIVNFECRPYAEAVTPSTDVSIAAEDDFESDVIFYPSIEVTLTANAIYVQVSLTSTGEYVRVDDATLVTNDVIVFNMSTGKVTKNAANCMDKVNLSSRFFGVPTGNQTITVTATSTFTANMDYTKRYLYA